MTIDIRELQTYRDLLTAVEPRPIRSEEEAAALTGLIDMLTDLPELTEGQREFVGLLGRLLYDWATEHEEPVEVSPQEVVQSCRKTGDSGSSTSSGRSSHRRRSCPTCWPAADR